MLNMLVRLDLSIQKYKKYIIHIIEINNNVSAVDNRNFYTWYIYLKDLNIHRPKLLRNPL